MLEGGQAGGRVYLVDFGGVQAAAMNQDFGSTVIGAETLHNDNIAFPACTALRAL